MEIKLKNRLHRYGINRPQSRDGHKYGKYKKCIKMMMLIYMYQATLQQHLKANSWKIEATLRLS